MSHKKKLRVLEALGYTSAMMVAVGGALDQRVLRIIHLFGLVFAVIVIVRLMVMNIRLAQPGTILQADDAVEEDDVFFPDVDDLDFSQDGKQHNYNHQYQS